MISLSGAVVIILYLLVAAMIFGLLWWLIDVVAGNFPTMAPFVGIARVVLAILAVLVLIGFLLSLVGGQPLFRP